jgi:hypothetical protein
MDRLDPSPEQQEILRVLDELVSFLRTWGEADHVASVDAARRQLADGHPDAIGQLSGVFGGRSTLRELVISKDKGHDIEDARVRPVNDRLRLLRSAAVAGISALQAETPRTDD